MRYGAPDNLEPLFTVYAAANGMPLDEYLAYVESTFAQNAL